MKRVLFFAFCCLITLPGISQVVNGYARVTNVSGAVLTVSDVDESDDTFEAGEFVVVMQMQDNVIGTTSNTSSFGSLGSILSAGLYEIIEITSVTESGGTPTSITLNQTPNNTYNTGSNSRVQVITFPTFGSPNYTTTADMSAMAWDGDVGGVVAFQVDGTLTLSHNIDADAAGFRGGAADGSSSGSCDVTTFRSTNTNAFAGKGEGIYLSTNSTYDEARGRILNGGGGGNEHNGGGAGGGNYSAGGAGGVGWNCGGSSAGGIGGLDLSGQITGSRVFMGGGGGGGEGNNSVATAGGDGGGIVLIKANEITTSGSCSGRTITADGESSSNAGNDGAGGAGAGGSIILDVNTWSIGGSCDLTIASDGGDGGDVGSSAVHGGGGGGGQGAVIFTVTEPSTNVTVQTTNGSGGCNNNSNPCTSSAGDGAGSNNAGIIDNTSTPLPIELVSFTGYRTDHSQVILEWATAAEINNDFFEVQRSTDAKSWATVIEVNGSGNSNQRIDYLEVDAFAPQVDLYYRLVQHDYDGSQTTSQIVEVAGAALEGDGDVIFKAFPNPVNRGSELHLQMENMKGSNVVLVLRDLSGHEYFLKAVTNVNSNSLEVVTISQSIPAGIYFISAASEEELLSLKLLVE